MHDPIDVVRRFNRSYTQRIGVLDDSFLGLGMPLGPVRLLFEIGAVPGSASTPGTSAACCAVLSATALSLWRPTRRTGAAARSR